MLSTAAPPTWANLQHHVGGLDARLVHDGLHHQRVLQDVLALALVELDACKGMDAARHTRALIEQQGDLATTYVRMHLEHAHN
jgi:hypothetical protein